MAIILMEVQVFLFSPDVFLPNESEMKFNCMLAQFLQ